jgi:cyclase
MLRTRVIPQLLLRRRGLVKTVRFKKPRYVGDPINVVRIFNEKEVDELMLLDIVATRSGVAPDFEFLEQIASEAFMPLSYGGAIRTLEHARRILRLGMEKVALNSVTFDDPGLIQRLADALGRQCVVASVDVRRTWTGRYEVFSHASRRVRESDPLKWIEHLVSLGAGEVVVNAVHRDGTMKGFDFTLLSMLAGRFDVPIVACGGAQSANDMARAARVPGVSALGVGARFIYEGPHRAVLVSYLSPDELARVRQASAATS